MVHFSFEWAWDSQLQEKSCGGHGILTGISWIEVEVWSSSCSAPLWLFSARSAWRHLTNSTTSLMIPLLELIPFIFHILPPLIGTAPRESAASFGRHLSDHSAPSFAGINLRCRARCFRVLSYVPRRSSLGSTLPPNKVLHSTQY
jgi:hypothetical protein